MVIGARWCLGVMLSVTALHPVMAAAQDSIPPGEGVRIGITYSPGVRPGLLVFGGARTVVLDSVRAILKRDLEYSDEFEIINLPFGDSLVLRVGVNRDDSANGSGGARSAEEAVLNYPLYAYLGADWAVNVHEDFDSSLVMTLFDVGNETTFAERRLYGLDLGASDYRMQVHRLADEIVRLVSGRAGFAASRLLFVSRSRIYRVDSDGAVTTSISPEGVEALSPVWAPDGRRVIYMEFPGTLFVHDVATGARDAVPVTTEHQNFTPAFSPDGRAIAFARASEEGTDIYLYNLADQCCLQRLTVGRLWDNLSPTFSPDGRRIAYVSTRPGLSQVYVMAEDGTDQELFAPFEWGVTGSSNAPEWSPDGLHVTFHREVNRSPQIFVMDIATRTVRQLTSSGRNTDPTWAPDGRHLGFVSDRTGSRQIWIIDIETGRVRQLTRLGEARLPAWSPRIAAPNN